MKVKAYKLNSFTQNIEGGNPAGVVLDADAIDDSQMQQLAEAIGFSETAFVAESDLANYKVRFFTPNAEVDLCGHATIAAFSLLRQREEILNGEYSQETKAGVLKIKVTDNTIYMQQSMPEFFEIIEREELLSCLGIDINDFEDKLPVQAVSTGLKDIFVPLKNQQILERLQPNMEKISEISKKYNAVGLHVFCLTTDSDAIALCRNFAPLYGIPEESATGTSNGALACYLYKYGIIKHFNKELAIKQGIFMNKPSVIKARLTVKNSTLEEIWVGGEAVLLKEDTYQV